MIIMMIRINNDDNDGDKNNNINDYIVQTLDPPVEEFGILCYLEDLSLGRPAGESVSQLYRVDSLQSTDYTLLTVDT